MGTVTKVTARDRDRKIIAGLEKHYRPEDMIMLGGVAQKVADVKIAFERALELMDDAEAKRADWHASVSASRKQEGELRSLRQALRDFVYGAFGDTSTVVSDFGFEPRKRPKTNVETKAEAVKKRREKRNAQTPADAKSRTSESGGEAPAVTTNGTARPLGTA